MDVQFRSRRKRRRVESGGGVLADEDAPVNPVHSGSHGKRVLDLWKKRPMTSLSRPVVERDIARAVQRSVKNTGPLWVALVHVYIQARRRL